VNNYVLKLYVTGRTSRTKRAIDNLARICEERLGDDYEIVVIDILEEPQAAEDESIIATPTLIKHMPPPRRRIIGDLSDTETVLFGLDLNSR
jgi:circadian clock protein KaiB